MAQRSEEYDPTLKAVIEFGGTDLLDHRERPFVAYIQLRRVRNSVPLRWTVTLKWFEVIHGLSRVVKLVADKLVTARLIYMENLPNDDGRFYVNLVTNLLKFYIDQAKVTLTTEPEEISKLREGFSKQWNPLVLHLGESFEVFEGDSLNFVESVELLQGKLDIYSELLRDRAGEEALLEMEPKILDLCVDLLACCHTFMDYVHPNWIEAQRSGSKMDEVARDHLIDDLNEKISLCSYKIWRAKWEDDDDLEVKKCRHTG